MGTGRTAIKKNKKFLIGLFIGGLFLYLTLRQIDFASCWQYIKNANFIWMFLAAIVYTLAFVVRAFRWQIMLAPLKTISSKRLFSFTYIGFFMNNILPLRLGEFVRAHIYGSSEKVRGVLCFLSLVTRYSQASLSDIQIKRILRISESKPLKLKETFGEGPVKLLLYRDRMLRIIHPIIAEEILKYLLLEDTKENSGQ